MPGAHPPMGPNSFIFAYIFAKKHLCQRSTSPLMGPCPPTGNPGSTTNDFHDDAGHHHGSQYKQIIALKRQVPSLAWALHLPCTSYTFWLTLTLVRYFGINFGKLYSFGLWAKLPKTQNNLLDKCLI